MDKREAIDRLNFVLKSLDSCWEGVEILKELAGKVYGDELKSIAKQIEKVKNDTTRMETEYKKVVAVQGAVDVVKSLTRETETSKSPYQLALDAGLSMIHNGMQKTRVRDDNVKSVVEDILRNKVKGGTLTKVLKNKGVLREGGQSEYIA